MSTKTWAVFGNWLVTLFLGFVLAWPWSQGLKAQGFSQFADGDARLLSAGGAYFLEALRLGFGHFQSLLLPTLVLGVGVVLVSLVPTAGLALAASSKQKLGPNALATRAVEHWWRFALLRLGTSLVQALLFGGVYVVQAWFRATSADVRQADLRTLSFVAAGLGLGAIVGCVQDVLRVALVRDAVSPHFSGAFGLSLRALRSEGVKLLISWALLASLCISLVGASAVFASRGFAEHPSLTFGLQQLLCLILIGIRLFWFSIIERALASAQKRIKPGALVPAETPANSAEPAYPS